MAQFIASGITMFIVANVLLAVVAYTVLLERKISAYVQDRYGPNRVGPFGLLQPIADGIKLMFKEDFTPTGVDRWLYSLAPILVVTTAMLGWAVIPWGGYLQWGDHVVLLAAAPIDIGVVFVLAVGSMAVYGVVVGGYAANNKYTFFGALRGTAQMLSYEIPLAVTVLIVILTTGTIRADLMVQTQAEGVWNVVYHPLAAVIFFTCLLAESNRMPFDLPETEQELVGGYHTEYSSMRFSLFFLGEYLHMIWGSAFLVLLFFGGWDLPLVREPIVGGIGWAILKTAVFAAKIGVSIVLMMMLRWTLPRFRFDQLMRLAWRSLVPISILLLLASGTVVFFKAAPVWHLVANIVLLAAAMYVGTKLPVGAPVNRRVPLVGSRFCPAPRQ